MDQSLSNTNPPTHSAAAAAAARPAPRRAIWSQPSHCTECHFQNTKWDAICRGKKTKDDENSDGSVGTRKGPSTGFAKEP
ncbi:hypothetical protein HYE67_004058 [Fusarium culmorum]|uniref:Uncharacterized protein n=1 Tax=Fusarium culmorum TaxID=5516 RepID=A0A2T4GMH6_FUSCU|nr:hypothetical protein FCULG_00001244 [Fusarium culmorum]QPC61827.1 hypothetical protein HYE67_004058 [Fusarium culmorum]